MALLVVVAACTGSATTNETTPVAVSTTTKIDPALSDALLAIADASGEFITREKVAAVVGFGDVQAGWAIADLLRFHQVGVVGEMLVAAAADLTGLPLDPYSPIAWVEVTNHLMATNVPAGDWLRRFKLDLYGGFEPEWKGFFGDSTSSVDWRFVTWGGVLPDRRPLDSTLACHCIPALDHPAVTEADGGRWLQPQRIVFGVVVNGEARAYPRHMMEFHELVNDTLGGREIAIPYCTLCGSAQAFFVGEAGDRLVLRTSGLLQRSNKIMYDLVSGSYYDTFAGVAISGPLRGDTLEQVPVVTSTWEDWRAAHPGTTILAEDGGLGWTYDPDPLGGRDLGGPIFPVGVIDGRLEASTKVLGIVVDGVAWAIPVVEAVAVLEAGGTVEVEGVDVRLDGSGLVAFAGGVQVVSHEAFWFAWSQFNPGTGLWSGDG